MSCSTSAVVALSPRLLPQSMKTCPDCAAAISLCTPAEPSANTSDRFGRYSYPLYVYGPYDVSRRRRRRPTLRACSTRRGIFRQI